MKQPIPIIVAGILLLIAVLLDVTAMPRISIWGGKPELVMIVLGCFGLLSRPSGSATLGFFAGALYGWLVGASLFYYVISRTLVGYGYGMASSWEPSARSAAGIIAVGTVIARMILMFIAPQTEIMQFLQATILTAIINGLIAWPVYAMLRRSFRPKVV